jgi:hypothetical protein
VIISILKLEFYFLRKKAESRFHNYLCRIGLSLQSQLSFLGTHPFLFFKNLPLHFPIVNLLLV